MFLLPYISSDSDGVSLSSNSRKLFILLIESRNSLFFFKELFNEVKHFLHFFALRPCCCLDITSNFSSTQLLKLPVGQDLYHYGFLVPLLFSFLNLHQEWQESNATCDFGDVCKCSNPLVVDSPAPYV